MMFLINRHNPCFIGKLLAIKIAFDIEQSVIESQSLFYWKTPCNKRITCKKRNLERVTILVLLENSLQYKANRCLQVGSIRHNPCFIGKLLAMVIVKYLVKNIVMSQSLFYWKTPCNVQGAILR